MPAVNGTVQSRKRFMAMMLTYSFLQRAILNLFDVFISKSKFAERGQADIDQPLRTNLD